MFSVCKPAEERIEMRRPVGPGKAHGDKAQAFCSLSELRNHLGLLHVNFEPFDKDLYLSGKKG
jgi:hypothetical protein